MWWDQSDSYGAVSSVWQSECAFNGAQDDFLNDPHERVACSWTPAQDNPNTLSCTFKTRNLSSEGLFKQLGVRQIQNMHPCFLDANWKGLDYWCVIMITWYLDSRSQGSLTHYWRAGLVWLNSPSTVTLKLLEKGVLSQGAPCSWDGIWCEKDVARRSLSWLHSPPPLVLGYTTIWAKARPIYHNPHCQVLVIMKHTGGWVFFKGMGPVTAFLKAFTIPMAMSYVGSSNTYAVNSAVL